MAASCIYDVFLSFSGVDTRKNFTAHLLAALERHDLYTFRDDTKLTRGEEIGPELLKAIEQSKVSVIIFSKSYASSRWCLDELVKIMNCKRRFGQIVIPIFYDIQPSDVRSQRGCYEEAFASHEKRFDMKMVKNWRSALKEAANLSGYDLQNMANGCESTFIETAVREVADKLNLTCLSVADYPVGIQPRVQKLSEFLKLGSNSDNVRIVAIWGIGGSGKTTIAKAMYNRIYRIREFESSSFLANVGPTSMQPNGFVELQEKLLCDLRLDGNQRIRSQDHGIEVIKRRAWCRKVLLVLDDVDNIRQLRALAINRDLLRSGSIIIVTTRNLSSVSSLQVDEVYKPKELNREESLQLFSWHAFRRGQPVEDYEILSEEVVSYAKGLPLVLEILGSFLSDKTVREWRSELKKLKKIPNNDVQGKLRLSFDSLDNEQRGLFLDIACFFVGMDQDLSIKILGGCGFFPESGIGVLYRRCLVSIDRHNRLMMHDLIQDMAKEIVRQESLEEPGERSRLWYHEDVLDVLKNNTGTKAIQGLVLNLPESEKVKLKAKAFTKMERLRLLHLNNVHLRGSYKHLSGRLVWLSWKGFSSNYIPSNLIMDNLVAIDLSYSKLKQVWRGTKVLYRLKYLNLGHSYFLINTPDFTGFASLEKLLLNDCTELVEVHQSIEHLKNLLVLNLKNCHNLQKIPLCIFTLNSLLDFSLSGCSKLEWPTFFQGSPLESSFSSLQLSSSIRELNMENCNITYVPSEIGSLVSLEFLNLSQNNFSILPATISSLQLLKALSVSQCTRLESIPELPVNLLTLHANYCTSLQSIKIESKSAETSLRRLYHFPDSSVYKFSRNLRYQGLREEGALNIFLYGLPRWCNYQSEGDVLSFQVPLLLGGTIFLKQGDDKDPDLCDASDHSITIASNIPPLNENVSRNWESSEAEGSLVYKGNHKDPDLCDASDHSISIASYILPFNENVSRKRKSSEAEGSLAYKGNNKDPDLCDASDHSITIGSYSPPFYENMSRKRKVHFFLDMSLGIGRVVKRKVVWCTRGTTRILTYVMPQITQSLLAHIFLRFMKMCPGNGRVMKMCLGIGRVVKRKIVWCARGKARILTYVMPQITQSLLPHMFPHLMKMCLGKGRVMKQKVVWFTRGMTRILTHLMLQISQSPLPRIFLHLAKTCLNRRYIFFLRVI
ncbi:disease resistance protein RPV1-like isoform X5 [Cornus florida]|uniref:disease resistance protein RPV1-like isoform X5 n=1 Tax=Cornus florida TaxID=4283 RepID=UPI00289D88F6|nr:disease resistance protein RPV1-like isoform X5 [Cornus florida]